MASISFNGFSLLPGMTLRSLPPGSTVYYGNNGHHTFSLSNPTLPQGIFRDTAGAPAWSIRWGLHGADFQGMIRSYPGSSHAIQAGASLEAVSCSSAKEGGKIPTRASGMEGGLGESDIVVEARSIFDELTTNGNLTHEREEVLRGRVMESPELADALRERLIGTDLPVPIYNCIHRIVRPENQGVVIVKPLGRRILVANRGEIAVRILREIEEQNRLLPESQRFMPIVVHAPWDKDSLFVRRTLEMGGEAHVIKAAPGEHEAKAYINIPGIIEVARQSGANFIHPGYGYKSESPEFSEAARNADIAFMGPPPEAARLAESKDEFKRICTREGIPVTQGTQQGTTDIDELTRQLLECGLAIQRDGQVILARSVRLKAVAAGGGRGQATVHNMEQLRADFPKVVQEGVIGFGRGDVIAEQFVPKFVHMEAQIVADRFGNIVVLGERECTLQERDQKLIEFSDSPLFDRFKELREKLRRAAVKAAKSLGYVGVGTVEFMVDPETGEFFAMELNARIQVEHAVTEMVSGVDIVHEQLRIAQGKPLSIRQDHVRNNGMAVEIRLKAVDPDRRTSKGEPIPTAGPVLELSAYGRKSLDELAELRREGIRIETSIETAGGRDRISQHGDPMFMKIVIHIPERDRKALLDKVDRVLDNICVVRPQGLTTDLSRQRALLKTRFVREGAYTNHTVNQWEEAGRKEDLTDYPFSKSATHSLSHAGLLQVRAVGFEPISSLDLGGLTARIRNYLGDGGSLEAPVPDGIADILNHKEFREVLNPPHAYDHSVIVDDSGNFISWTVLNQAHRPIAVLTPIHGAVRVRTNDGNAMTGNQQIVAFELLKNGLNGTSENNISRRNGDINGNGSKWGIRRWLVQEGPVKQLVLLDAKPIMGAPVSGITRFDLSPKNRYDFESDDAEQGHNHVFRGFRIRNRDRNIVCRISPADFVTNPWDRLPYLLAELPPSAKEIPAPIQTGLLMIDALPPDKREEALQAIAGCPEGLEASLYQLQRLNRLNRSSEKVRLAMLLSEILLRRSLFGLRILEVRRDEGGEAIGVRFRYYDHVAKEYREKTLVRAISDFSDQASDEAMRAVRHAHALLEKMSAPPAPDPIVEIMVMRRDGAHVEIAPDWFEGPLNNESPLPPGSKVKIFDDRGSVFPVPDTFCSDESGVFRRDSSRHNVYPATAASHQLWRYDANHDVRVLDGSEPHNMALLAQRRAGGINRLIGFGLLQGASVERSSERGPVESVPAADQAFCNLLDRMKKSMGDLPEKDRPVWNRFVLRVVGQVNLTSDEAIQYVLGLCEEGENELAGLHLEKGIVTVRVPDSRAPEGRRHLMITIKKPGVQFEAAILNGIHAIVHEGDQVVKRRVWVNSEVYENWIRDQSAPLRETEYILDRPVRTLKPVEMEIAKMRARGLSHWKELAEKFTDLLPGGKYERLEYGGFERNRATGFIDPDSGKLQAIGSPSSSRLGPEEKNGFDVVVLRRKEGERSIPDSVLLVGNHLANYGQLTPIEQGTKNAAIRLASQWGVPVIVCANNISGAGIDSPVIEVNKADGKVTVRFPVVSAAPNLDAIATTMRDLDLVAQKLGVPVIGMLNGLNIGGQAYEHSQASMQPETAGVVIMLPKASASLTGTRAWAIAQTPGLRTADIPATAKKRFPNAEVDLAGAGILGVNEEAVFLSESMDEAVRRVYQWKELTRRDFVGDQLPVVDKSNVVLEGSSDTARLVELLSPYKSSKPQRDAWAKLLFDSNPQSLQLFRGANLNTQVHVGRIGGEPTMLIVSPAIFTTEDSRAIAKAIRKASINRLHLVIAGTFAGFMPDPKSMGDRQLEHGADIAKALTEYSGPGVLIYIHGVMAGGNYVVFAESINSGLVTLAASPASQVVVVGGRPAVQAVHINKVAKFMEQLTNDPALLVKAAQGLRVSVDGEKITSPEFSEKVQNAIEDLVARKLDASTSACLAYEQGHLTQIICPEDLREAVMWHQHGRRLDWDRQRNLLHDRELVIALLRRWSVPFGLASRGWAIEIPEGKRALTFREVIECVDSIPNHKRNVETICQALQCL